MNLDHIALKLAGTAVVSDVFDSLGIEPPVLDNDILAIGDARAFAGPAYTIAGKLLDYDGGDAAKMQAIDAMPGDAVALWAGHDVRGVCCFGDLLASSMRARGCVAAVVDGGVRDVQSLGSCGLPVMARYRTPAQGVGRWKVTGFQVPVQVRGALQPWLTVAPGDILVGDADGILCVPKELVAAIVPKVKAWSETEDEARADIASGLPLLAALAKYGHL